MSYLGNFNTMPPRSLHGENHQACPFCGVIVTYLQWEVQRLQEHLARYVTFTSLSNRSNGAQSEAKMLSKIKMRMLSTSPKIQHHLQKKIFHNELIEPSLKNKILESKYKFQISNKAFIQMSSLNGSYRRMCLWSKIHSWNRKVKLVSIKLKKHVSIWWENVKHQLEREDHRKICT